MSLISRSVTIVAVERWAADGAGGRLGPWCSWCLSWRSASSCWTSWPARCTSTREIGRSGTNGPVSSNSGVYALTTGLIGTTVILSMQVHGGIARRKCLIEGWG
jgi:hypothetical protein